MRIVRNSGENVMKIDSNEVKKECREIDARVSRALMKMGSRGIVNASDTLNVSLDVLVNEIAELRVRLRKLESKVSD